VLPEIRLREPLRRLFREAGVLEPLYTQPQNCFVLSHTELPIAQKSQSLLRLYGFATGCVE